MPDQAPTFYVTTPIYYVNARPHIGHAYTTLVADVLARRHRLLGHETFFLTGTDEHGQKIERSAIAAGIPPEQFTTAVSDSFRRLWHRMGITYTGSPAAPPSPFALPTFTRPEAGFIRTTDPDHIRGVQKLFTELKENGFIYKGTYTGQYCVSDEVYVEGPPGIHCPDCGRLTETVSEENYYFKLSAFQRPLLELIEADSEETPPLLRIRPYSARKEVLSFLCGPKGKIVQDIPTAPEEVRLEWTTGGNVYVPGALKDLSISRTSFSWGVPVPGDEKHVIYVWLDALANYMTALGYGAPESDPAAQALFAKFWPANLHLVGKEITRFHCVYWPAFLLALNPALKHAPDQPVPVLTLEQHQAWAKQWLPKEIVANGWLLFDNAKMSKSRGNVVRSETILTGFGDQYFQGIRKYNDDQTKKNPTFQPVPEPTPAERDLFATDVLRYFLLREIPFGQDGSFSFEAMYTRYNADLTNGYANLVSRVLSLIQRYGIGGRALSERSGWKQDDWLTYAFGVSPNMTAWSVPGDPEPVLSRYSMYQTMEHVTRCVSLIEGKFGEVGFQAQLAEVLLAVGMTDGFFTQETPWKIADDPFKKPWLDEVLYTAAESIRILTALLYPILPFATARVWAQLGLGDIEYAAARGDLRDLQWGGLEPGTKLGPLAPIFPRADKGLAQTMADLESTPPPSLLHVANDEHDAATSEATAFREAPLASVSAGTTDQPLAAEARSEASSASTTEAPGAPSMAHRDMGGSAKTPAGLPTGSSMAPGSAVPAEPTGTLISSTDPGAGPRTGSTRPNGNPGAQVAGSYATTTGPHGAPTSHADAEPSGIFAGSASTTPVSSSPVDASPQISIDDFAKIELRVAQIVVAERIPKADKLLRLEVDLGYEKRQILSGIAEWYTPEELIGRRIVVITNLAPRKMRGLDSRGMLLAASAPESSSGDPKGGKPVLATFAEDIALGSRLK